VSRRPALLVLLAAAGCAGGIGVPGGPPPDAAGEGPAGEAPADGGTIETTDWGIEEAERPAADAAADGAIDRAGDVPTERPDAVRPPGECDPYATDACPAGRSCDIMTSCDTVCAPAGDGAEGEPCAGGEGTTLCQAGLTCVGGGPADARCVRWCRAAAECPGDGARCIAVGIDGGPCPGLRVCRPGG
jgi:hypothetical protein